MSDTAPTESADVVIIGAGVIGCALALELSRRGHATVNVDKAAAAGSGSTINSCAIIRFSYSTEEGVNFAWEGGQYWPNWADHIGTDDELGLIEYHECGQLVMTSETDPRAERVAELWAKLDIPFERLDLDQLSTRFPWLDHGMYGPPKRPEDPTFWDDPKATITGAIYTPNGGYVSDPQLSCHNLQRGAEAHGARFLFNREVVSVDRTDGRVSGVTFADGGRVAAPVVVNVAGPHSAVINRMAGVLDEMNIKTAALRHEVHHVPSPPGIDFEASGVVVADDDVGFYCRPEVGNHVLLGSVDAACDPREFVDPDDYDRSIGEEQWHMQVLRANRRINDLGVPHERKGIVDLYDVSDDWLPIYDRTALDGFYVAIGTSGNQYKNAGVAGQVMADLIEAVEAGHDHDHDPVVSVGRYTGRDLNVGFFSRNREINADSSMSVHG
ncbi:MAG: FAD-dependent oxidoreductase [Acidimicrobiales bacterium]|nr:FAD-dependent oxidoreductase [Acidimicrobiales bacterium]